MFTTHERAMSSRLMDCCCCCSSLSRAAARCVFMTAMTVLVMALSTAAADHDGTLYLSVVQPSGSDGSASGIPAWCLSSTSTDVVAAALCRTVSVCLKRDGVVNMSAADGFEPIAPSPSTLNAKTLAVVLDVVRAGPTRVVAPSHLGSEIDAMMIVHSGNEAMYAPFTPFSVTDLLPAALLGVKLTVTLSCFTITLPAMPGLDVARGTIPTLALQFGTSTLFTSSDLVSLLNQTTVLIDIAYSEPPDALIAIGYVGSVNLALGAMGLWTTPAPPSLPEAWIAIAAFSSGCTQQNLREVSAGWLGWGFLPFSGPSMPAAENLWRTAVVLVGGSCAHAVIFAVCLVWRARRYAGTAPDQHDTHSKRRHTMLYMTLPAWDRDHSSNRQLMATLCFPRLTIAWVLLWSGPLTYAAVAVLRDFSPGEGDASNSSVAAVLGAVIWLVSCVVGVVGLPWCVRVLYDDVHRLGREHQVQEAACSLPQALQWLMPRKVWGPPSLRAAWGSMFLSTNESTKWWAALPWGHAVLQLCILTPWAADRSSCTAQSTVSLIVATIYIILLLRKRPYSSVLLLGALVLQTALYAVCQCLNAERSGSTDPLTTQQGMQTLAMLLHIVGVGRGVATILIGFLQVHVIEPVAWRSYETMLQESWLKIDETSSSSGEDNEIQQTVDDRGRAVNGSRRNDADERLGVVLQSLRDADAAWMERGHAAISATKLVTVRAATSTADGPLDRFVRGDTRRPISVEEHLQAAIDRL